MADFTPQTKYDIGQEYYKLISQCMNISAENGILCGSGDLRAVRKRLSALEQWARCIAAIVDDYELKEVGVILAAASNKIHGNMIRMSILNDLNDAEIKLYSMMKAHNMLTKMEHKLTGMDRARAGLGIVGKPRGKSVIKEE